MSRKPEKANVNSPGPPDVPQEDEDPGFFRRWSERKRRVRAAQGDEPLPAATSSVPQAEAAAGAADDTSERVLTDEDMPTLDSLNEDSDYSGFFSPGVSEPLRRAALRKLFSSAKLNIVDGLDDYAEDYRSFEALGDIITSDMRFEMEREAERAKQALDDKTREVAEDTEVAATDAEEHAGERAASGKGPADAESDAGDNRIARVESETPDSDDGDMPDDDQSPTV